LFSANFFGERFGAALVVTAPGSYGGSTVTEREGITKFGKPYRIYRFQRYAILVWRKTCCRN